MAGFDSWIVKGKSPVLDAIAEGCIRNLDSLLKAGSFGIFIHEPEKTQGMTLSDVIAHYMELHNEYLYWSVSGLSSSLGYINHRAVQSALDERRDLFEETFLRTERDEQLYRLRDKKIGFKRRFREELAYVVDVHLSLANAHSF